jgi:hypothetical protein
MEKRFSGGSQTWDEPTFLVKGATSRSTPPPELVPFYKILTPRDLDAVVSYVRSVPPVRNEVQPPVYKAPMHVELIPGAEKPFEETALRDPRRARILSRYHRPLHGMSCPPSRWGLRLHQLARQGRP